MRVSYVLESSDLQHRMCTSMVPDSQFEFFSSQVLPGKSSLRGIALILSAEDMSTTLGDISIPPDLRSTGSALYTALG